MNENIDLTKILEGCPMWTKFYSTIHDEISFKRIELPKDYPIVFDSDAVGGDVTLTEKGMAIRGVGECIVFPSKEQRDWSKFERFWDKPKKVDRFDPKTLKPFDKILVRKVHSKYNIEPWSCEHFSYINPNTKELVNGISSRYEICIPYNDETEHLLGTTDDCPEYYKWWGELF